MDIIPRSYMLITLRVAVKRLNKKKLKLDLNLCQRFNLIVINVLELIEEPLLN